MLQKFVLMQEYKKLLKSLFLVLAILILNLCLIVVILSGISLISQLIERLLLRLWNWLREPHLLVIVKVGRHMSSKEIKV